MLENVYNLEKLTDKQKQAIKLLLSGKTNEEVAKQLGINITTIYRWKRQNVFRKVLNDKQNAILDDICNELHLLGNKAVDVLKELMEDASNENNRLKASMYIIDKLFQIRDAELLTKVEEIEIVLKNRGIKL